MDFQEEDLLVICTGYNQWTSLNYKGFGIEMSGPGNREKVKAISFDHCWNDFLGSEKSGAGIPDIIVFNEEINPKLFKKERLLEVFRQKSRVSMVLHRLNIAPYKKWIQEIAGQKFASHQLENSLESRTNDLLRNLANAYRNREREEYDNHLKIYFDGREHDDLLEMKLRILNTISAKDLQNFLRKYRNNEDIPKPLKRLFLIYPGVSDLFKSLVNTSDAQEIISLRREISTLFFSNKG